MITLQKVLEMAADEAAIKLQKNLFIKVGDEEFDWEDQDNWKNGDPENIHSIAALYAQEKVAGYTYEDLQSKIEEKLAILYPEHI